MTDAEAREIAEAALEWRRADKVQPIPFLFPEDTRLLRVIERLCDAVLEKERKGGSEA